ncbi:Os07g0561900 [Oryza sativa Japonica Group]|uniref:Os07g0561900 protein n=1 Tax=Oryza sativa subsp. japonica TaxID=39947 RepID=C7J509_ORYSJ|nr:Os07g0561900 [Oryza sativa Japonica Group]|eukprot:NP_001175258.1 Os07g0561900 [Oryza sativa Japonica Group]
MVVPCLARAVLATPARAFVPSCPGVWQTLCDVSSFTVRLHRLFGINFLNDCRDRVTVIISCTSSRTLVHDHSTTPHARPVARLPRHQLPDIGYIDHGYSTHGFIDHGSFGSFILATSTMAQRAIIRVEHSCRFLLQSKCPRCSRLKCGGMFESY